MNRKSSTYKENKKENIRKKIELRNIQENNSKYKKYNKKLKIKNIGEIHKMSKI